MRSAEPQEKGIRSSSASSGASQASDLTLRLLEFLASEPLQRGVTELSQHFALPKATIHRHLRTLLNRDFLRQDPVTLRYEPGIKLFQLGERLRDRFSIAQASREAMQQLRDATGQAVTVSALVDGRVVVLDLVQGSSVIEFGIRPGTEMSLTRSAHGKVALAFGPAQLLADSLRRASTSKSSAGIDAESLARQIEAARKQGWVTAANEVVFGMNALAAPVFDSRGAYAGAIAIVGSVQFIAARPKASQHARVKQAARQISHQLGWRSH